MKLPSTRSFNAFRSLALELRTISRLIPRRLEYDFQSVRCSCPEVFCKKVFIKISQNLQENTCARDSFLIKLQFLIKKRLWYRCFPANFAKFQRTSFFTKHLQWLLLVCSSFVGRRYYGFEENPVKLGVFNGLRHVVALLNYITYNIQPVYSLISNALVKRKHLS